MVCNRRGSVRCAIVVVMVTCGGFLAYLYVGATLHRDRIGSDWAYLRDRHNRASQNLHLFLDCLYEFYDNNHRYPGTIEEAIAACPASSAVLFNVDGVVIYDIDLEAIEQLGDRLGVAVPAGQHEKVIGVQLADYEERAFGWRFTDAEIAGMRTVLLSDGSCLYLDYVLHLPYRGYGTLEEWLEDQ